MSLSTWMGDLQLVHPALNLSKFDDVLLEHGGLPHVLPPEICLPGQVEGTILRYSYSLSFVLGPLLHT